MPLHSALLTARGFEFGFSIKAMNKRIITLGVAAIGVAGVQAADAGKVWEVTASLRGFYDDNYTTSPEKLAEESWGIEVSPGINLTIGEGTDTEFSAGYAFGMRYYEDRGESDNEDYGHELGISLNKAFSDTSVLLLSDSLVVAQEPEILNGGTSRRVEGDNLRNTFAAQYRRVLSGSTGVEIGYGNSIFDYEQEFYSALLDRSYNEVSLDVFYGTAQTEYYVGYQFSSTDFDGGELQAGLDFNADARNNHAHYGYVGARHQLNKNFIAQNVDYYNFDLAPKLKSGTLWIPEDETSPYVDARMEWEYAEGGKLIAGASLARGATDLKAADQEISSVYAQLIHKISAKVHGSLTGRFQDAEINGGGDPYDGKEESLLLLGASLTYAIADNTWAEVAYNYDELDSVDSNRSFERNYVSIGIGTSY